MNRTTARPRRRQQDRTAEARRRLAEATIDCLSRCGYAGTTLQQVADAAGLSRGAVQHHYESKLDLVADAAEHLLDGALMQTIATAHRLGPGDPKPFHTLVHQLWTRLVAHPRYGASLEIFAAARADPELRARIEPVLRRLSTTLGDAIAALFRPRRPGGDPVLLIGMTFTMLRGLALEAPISRDPGWTDRALDAWAAILDQGLALADAR